MPRFRKTAKGYYVADMYAVPADEFRINEDLYKHIDGRVYNSTNADPTAAINWGEPHTLHPDANTPIDEIGVPQEVLDDLSIEFPPTLIEMALLPPRKAAINQRNAKQ